MNTSIGRRGFIAGVSALLVSACSKVAESDAAKSLFSAAPEWHRKIHRSLASRMALAKEYPRSAISPDFRGNGSRTVDTDAYRTALAAGFPDWKLEVSGMVATPLSLGLEDIRKLPQRTQVTRHDCVEGWSAIGEWTGPQLSAILDAAGVKDGARFVVFRCADTYAGRKYYESIDMVDARHPQTIVAHSLNGEPIPEKNGAPLRMRIERQLGYKQAKYLTGIEVVDTLESIGEGKGGYWEDRAGYQWYAGM
jgi:DMSO/TMAO reductase YedYZ molybdopterin-dependent catalytic subunit